MRKVYNAAIIGAGNIGAFYSKPKNLNSIITHAHTYTNEPRINFVGFVDADKQKANKAAKIWKTKVFTNIQDIFAQHYIDIISVCVPDEIHHTVLNQLIPYTPKVVLCENL